MVLRGRSQSQDKSCVLPLMRSLEDSAPQRVGGRGGEGAGVSRDRVSGEGAAAPQ